MSDAEKLAKHLNEIARKLYPGVYVSWRHGNPVDRMRRIDLCQRLLDNPPAVLRKAILKES